MSDENAEVLGSVVEEAPAAVEERPAWLPGNFKSPEDLAKSYQSAQGELTRTQQELAQLRATVEELASAQQTRQAEQHYSSVEEQLVDAIESGDPRQQLAAYAWLAQEAAKTAVQQHQPQAPVIQQDPDVLALAVDTRMRQTVPDWDDVRGDIGVVLEELPGLKPTSTNVSEIASNLRVAAEIARARKMVSGVDAVRQVEHDTLAAAKNAAATITGSSVRPATVTPEQAAWEAIKQAETAGIRLGRL